MLEIIILAKITTFAKDFCQNFAFLQEYSPTVRFFNDFPTAKNSGCGLTRLVLCTALLFDSLCVSLAEANGD